MGILENKFFIRFSRVKILFKNLNEKIAKVFAKKAQSSFFIRLYLIFSKKIKWGNGKNKLLVFSRLVFFHCHIIATLWPHSCPSLPHFVWLYIFRNWHDNKPWCFFYSYYLHCLIFSKKIKWGNGKNKLLVFSRLVFFHCHIIATSLPHYDPIHAHHCSILSDYTLNKLSSDLSNISWDCFAKGSQWQQPMRP